MYIPTIYKQENRDEIVSFIKENSFAILISQVQNKPWATHIPMYLEKKLDGKMYLSGHLSKGNIQSKNFTEQENVLCIFSGPNAYISPSWYNHENVPTWNYSAVHVYGFVKILEGDEIRLSLKKLIDKYEIESSNPISFETMSENIIQADIGGIICFEIEITEIQAVNKMSQNRDLINHENIINELEKSAKPMSISVAKCMRNTGITN